MKLAADAVHQVIAHGQGDKNGHVVEQAHLVFVGEAFRAQEEKSQDDECAYIKPEFPDSPISFSDVKSSMFKVVYTIKRFS